MDPAKKPPEMSMYLSVLRAAGLHREEGGVWRIAEPLANDDTSNVRPFLARILDVLEARRGGRVKVTDLFAELRRPPFGLRDGLTPLMLAVFVSSTNGMWLFTRADGSSARSPVMNSND